MAKAVLVLDEMPMDCEDCNLSYRNAYAGVRCSAIEKPIGDTWASVANGERFALCPLKALPKEKNKSVAKLSELTKKIGGTYSQWESYNSGFNDCLKEITGDD